MVSGTSPERHEVVQGPWEVVTAMGIDSLEETEADPHVHGQDVEVSTVEVAVDDWGEDGSNSEHENFDRVSVFSGETEWGGELVVDLMDVLVEGTVVEETVEPVVPSILHDEEDGKLHGHGLPGWERDIGGHSSGLGEWVEEPDLRELDGKVSEENGLGASPLLSWRREFLLRKNQSY